MSSIRRSIIIEEYVNGGFGIHTFKHDDEDDTPVCEMGLSDYDEIDEVLSNWYREKKAVGA